LLVLLGGITGCACGCNDECKRVASIEIVPPEVSTTPATTFELAAVARDAAGTVITGELPVKWSGDVAFDDPGANPVRAAAEVGVHAARVKIGKVGSATDARIIVASPDVSTVTTDKIEIDQADGSPPADVILDAHAKADPSPPDCVAKADRQYSVAGLAVLSDNLTAGCTNEVAVFAASRAPLVTRLAHDLWTDASDLLKPGPLPAPIAQPVHVWYFVADPDAATRGAVQTEYATWIFEHNRAGIAVEITAEHQMESLDYSPSGSCADIEDVLTGFVATAGAFHIVYVEDITNPWNHRGYACLADDQRGEIVVMSYAQAQDATLAHEISHQLGFSIPPFPLGYAGHVNDYPPSEGFTGTNVMWVFDPPQSIDGRVHLTLGQVYRMHVDERSWLNRASLRTAGHTAPCQAQATKGTCPRLGHDRGSP
jgi:hypothetical protein